MIQVEGLVSGYGAARVLHGVDLSVRAGEVLAVIGPNGAGKSTLVGAIAGIRRLWKGSITVDGRDISALRTEERVAAGVVLCPEGRRILSTLSVEENLVVGATVRTRRERLPTAGRHALLDEMYSRFPILHERRHQRGGALSGGQQQMLAIGRALMAQPKVLLLDEPSLGLAPVMVAAVYELLEKLRTEGRAIILVEESASRPLSFADRAIVMTNGSVVLDGTAADVATDPELQSAYLGSASSSTPVRPSVAT